MSEIPAKRRTKRPIAIKRQENWEYVGRKVEKILGATHVTEELQYLVKYSRVAEPEIVPARMIDVQAPKKVIEFFESLVVACEE